MKLIFLIYILIYNFILSFIIGNHFHSHFKKYKLKTSKSHFSTKFRSAAKSLLSMKSINVNNLNSKERFQGYPEVNVDNTIDIGKGPIYSQGWAKYFVINKNTKGAKKSANGMREFNVNLVYDEEQSDKFKKIHNIDKDVSKANENTLVSPSKNHFYFILTDDKLSVISSRFVKNIF